MGRARPDARVLLLTNEPAAARALLALLPARFARERVVWSPPPASGSGAAAFAARTEDAVVDAAVEWLALARCELVVSALHSAFAESAAARGAGVGVEIQAGTGRTVAHGELMLTRSWPAATAPCAGARAAILRAWGLDDALCDAREPPPGRPRVHVGRTTVAAGPAAARGSRDDEAGAAAAAEPPWTVVDVAPGGDGVVRIDDMAALPFADGSVGELYASHCLEHAGWRQAGATLREWRRVVAPGGGLSVAVPDVPALARLLDADEVADEVATFYVLYGAQRDATDFHRSGYSERLLTALLREAGWCGVRRVRDFGRFARDSTLLEIGGVPISLNLLATAC